MGVIKYVLSMPYHMILNDVKEYIELRKKYKDVNGECERLYDGLSSDVNFGCVSFFEENNKVWFRDGKRVNYCENFFHKNCTMNECPCVKNHNLYWKLMDERKKLLTAKAEFWDAKFQNVR